MSGASAAVTPDRAVQRLHMDGELTILTAAERKAFLLEAIRKPYTITELDLSGVSELDTAGVQLLLLACRVSAAVGGALRVVAESGAVSEILDLVHLRAQLAAAASNADSGADSDAQPGLAS
jgi:anti-anti-sigma factor